MKIYVQTTVVSWVSAIRNIKIFKNNVFVTIRFTAVNVTTSLPIRFGEDAANCQGWLFKLL